MSEAKAATGYKVLCWGACLLKRPCSINYTSTKDGTSRRAQTGDVIADIDPKSVKANRFIERGRLEEVT